jgi:hypothetical protein
MPQRVLARSVDLLRDRQLLLDWHRLGVDLTLRHEVDRALFRRILLALRIDVDGLAVGPQLLDLLA